MKTTRPLYHLLFHFWPPSNIQLCFVTFVLLSPIVTWVEYDYETVVMVELPPCYFCCLRCNNISVLTLYLHCCPTELHSVFELYIVAVLCDLYRYYKCWYLYTFVVFYLVLNCSINIK